MARGLRWAAVAVLVVMAAIQIIESRANAQISYPFTSNQFQHSRNLPSPVVIYGSDPGGGIDYMRDGRDYLVLYGCAFGLGDTGGNAEGYFNRNAGAAPGDAMGTFGGGGYVHGTPEAMRACNSAGFVVHSAANGYNLDFAYRPTTTGKTLYIKGMGIVAMDLSDLVEGTDYWKAIHLPANNADFQATSTDNSYQAAQTLAVNITEAGIYSILVMLEGQPTSSAEGTKMRLQVDVNGGGYSTVQMDYVRGASTSTLDHHPFMLAARYIAAATGTHTFRLEGGGLSGANPKNFIRGRIFVLRDGALDQVVHSVTAAQTEITNDYPNYQTAAQLTHTPGQAEKVLTIGNAFAYRADEGSLIARLRNLTDGTDLVDFHSDANIDNLDQNRTKLFAFGVENISSPKQYALQVAAEQVGGQEIINTYHHHADIMSWSMRTADVSPPDYEDTVTETFSIGDLSLDPPVITAEVPEETLDIGFQIEGTPIGGEVPTGNVSFDGTNEPTVTGGITPPGGGGISLSHPRLWLTPTRIAQMQEHVIADTDTWQQFETHVLSNLTGLNDADIKGGTVLNLLVYSVLADHEASGAAAQAAVLSAVADGWGNNTERVNYWLYAREFAMAAACCYDWRYDKLSAQQRTDIIRYLNRGCSEIYVDGSTNPWFWQTHWATYNDLDNFFYSQLTVATVTAIATFGENDFQAITDSGATDGTPPGTLLPLSLYNDLDGTYHNDVLAFVYSMCDACFDTIDRYGEAGSWHEGQQYATASRNQFLKIGIFLRDAGGTDYLTPRRTMLEKHLRHYFMCSTPTAAWLTNDRDQGRDKFAQISPYERRVIAMLRDAIGSGVWAEYAQYWLDNYVTPIPGGWTIVLCWELAFYKLGAPATNYKSFLPTALVENPVEQYAYDWAHSREDWSDDAICVWFMAAHQTTSHGHEDVNHFMISRGNGKNCWLAADANSFPGNDGLVRSTVAHNTLSAQTNGAHQSFWGDPGTYPPTGQIIASDITAEARWFKGDGSDAFFEHPFDQPTWHGALSKRIVDVWLRDLVHVLPNFVVVHDRVHRTDAYYPIFPEIELFINSRATMVNLGGGIFRATDDQWVSASGYRMFHKLLLPTSGYTAAINAVPLTDTGNPDYPYSAYQGSYYFPNAPQGFESLILIEITDDQQAAMTTHDVVQALTGNMTGVVIRSSPTEQLILFPSSTLGNDVVNDVIYEYSVGGAIMHRLYGLKPNTGYYLTYVNNGGTGQVTVSEGGSFVANNNGVLVFDPTSLDPPDFSDTVTNAISIAEEPIEVLVDAPTPTESFNVPDLEVTPNFVPPSNDTVEESFNVDDLAVTPTVRASTPAEAFDVTEDVDASLVDAPNPAEETVGFDGDVGIVVEGVLTPPSPQAQTPPTACLPDETHQSTWIARNPDGDPLDDHLLVDEMVETPDENDWILSNGIGQVLEFGLTDGNTYSGVIKTMDIPYHYKASADTNFPGLRLEILLDGQVIATKEVKLGSASYVSKQVTFTGLSIDGFAWRNGDRRLRITTIDGGALSTGDEFEETLP